MSPLSGLLVALVAASSPHPRGEILDFSAKWCGPCQSVAPIVARLERDGYPIRSVDVDEQRAVAERFGITAMPTFILLVDGREVDRRQGMMSETELRAWLQRIPQDAPGGDVAALTAARGQSSPFVADPNVRLGAPQPFAMVSPNESSRGEPLDERTPPARSSAPAFPDNIRTADAAPPQGQASGMEIRGNNASLNGASNTPESAAAPMSASVRLRVTIDGHINLGSGTIIFCDGRQALIVTCGHIFRGSSPDSQIEVNLFDGAETRSLAGRLVKFDEEADVGLLTIDTDKLLPSVPVARDVQRAQVQEPVLNIGCSGGQPPTAEELVVTAVNPYLGPDNLECTGVPVQGRSGGGLFLESGELAGVCIAADPKRKRGVYAGLLAIHELLEGAGYAHLFRTPEVPASRPAVADAGGNGFDQFMSSRSGSEADASPRGSLLDSLSPPGEFPSPPAGEPAGMPGDALVSNAADPSPRGVPLSLGPAADDAEVVCIIRSRDPQRPDSQVVIIHQASPKLLSYLRGEMGTDVSPAGAGSFLSHQPARRSRAESVPTMDVSSEAAPAAELLRTGEVAPSRRPALQPTVMTATVQPRRYVRSR